MKEQDLINSNNKVRIIQESVPGKQVSLAHIIANPDEILFIKLGLNPTLEDSKSAMGIVTMTPSETIIIASDLAMKAASIELNFVDRLSGTLVFTGTISEVESSLIAITDYAKNKLGFEVCDITKN